MSRELLKSDEEKILPIVDKEPVEFSLVKGGPLYQLLVRTGLVDKDLARPGRMVIAFVLFAWLPQLVLSLIEGRAAAGVTVPFLFDIENQVRFLVALPLILLAESTAEGVIAPRICQFIDRRLIREESIPKFRAVIDSTHRRCDSFLIEFALIILVYTCGIWIYSMRVATVSETAPTWYATPDGVRWNLTFSGYWMIFVALPLFQFLLVRFYIRILNWFVFLRQVSRLDLNLVPTHSDRAAGLGFLV